MFIFTFLTRIYVYLNLHFQVMPEHLLKALRHPALIQLMAHIHQPEEECVIYQICLFLSDPGIPGVRSMGQSVCLSVTN